MNTKVTGYTAHARWYAANTAEDAPLLGWTRIAHNITKPVSQTLDGVPYIVLGDADARAGYAPAFGLNHLSVRFVECTTPIVINEDDLYVKAS